MQQPSLFENDTISVEPFNTQLLKWVGNKQRYAHQILSYFPASYDTFYEPFLGSGAVLGTLAPPRAVASDALRPLIEIFALLKHDPDQLLTSYSRHWAAFQEDRDAAYERVKESFHANPNGPDLFFLSRSCYGGVIRFRTDGYMSTPIGSHNPVSPQSVTKRVRLWRKRTDGAAFRCCDFEDTLDQAGDGDIAYCDPPYSHTQSILYGAQEFSLERLFRAIARAKNRGAKVALSIDGYKKSGAQKCRIPMPEGLFERVALIDCGRSMLKRFQMKGESLEDECVADRLALTW